MQCLLCVPTSVVGHFPNAGGCEGIIAFEDILKPKAKPQGPENLQPQTLASTILARPEVRNPQARNPALAQDPEQDRRSRLLGGPSEHHGVSRGPLHQGPQGGKAFQSEVGMAARSGERNVV